MAARFIIISLVTKRAVVTKCGATGLFYRARRQTLFAFSLVMLAVCDLNLKWHNQPHLLLLFHHCNTSMIKMATSYRPSIYSSKVIGSDTGYAVENRIPKRCGPYFVSDLIQMNVIVFKRRHSHMSFVKLTTWSAWCPKFCGKRQNNILKRLRSATQAGRNYILSETWKHHWCCEYSIILSSAV